MDKVKKEKKERKPWVRPAVEKIAAGQAENFTRNASSDGQFTAS